MRHLSALIDDDEDDPEPVGFAHEAEFPVMLLVAGSTSSRSFRFRWSTSPEGGIDAVLVLCPECSAPMAIRNHEVGTFGVLTSSLACPRCEWRTVAFGSPSRIRGIVRRRTAAGHTGPSRKTSRRIPAPERPGRGRRRWPAVWAPIARALTSRLFTEAEGGG